MRARIIKTVYVESARRVLAEDGSVAITGDSYRIDLQAESEVRPDIGWVIDYAELKQLFEPVRLLLDHQCLNDIPELERDCSPAAIEAWIHGQLEPWPDWFAGVRVSLPAPDCFTLNLLPPDPVLKLPERMAFAFSAAQSLPQLPKGHPCRELHGHTYQVEIVAPSNDALTHAARKLHERLHHVYINTLPGLEQATAERIAAWIWHRLEESGVRPSLVAVQETPNNRCHYHGG